VVRYLCWRMFNTGCCVASQHQQHGLLVVHWNILHNPRTHHWGICRYTRAYTEGSSVSGRLVQDSLWLSSSLHKNHTGDRRLRVSRKLQQRDGNASIASTSTGVRVAFGCVADERGQIYSQRADGILGLADEPLAIPAQLAAVGVAGNTFTLCYGPSGGAGPHPLDSQCTAHTQAANAYLQTSSLFGHCSSE
jgi:Xylanase inhibitor N-terminal